MIWSTCSVRKVWMYRARSSRSPSDRGRQVAGIRAELRLDVVEDGLEHPQALDAPAHARVAGHLQHRLAQLEPGQPVRQRDADLDVELGRALLHRERRDGDQRAITGRERRALPDVADRPVDVRLPIGADLPRDELTRGRALRHLSPSGASAG
jgi:hypothetical protein